MNTYTPDIYIDDQGVERTTNSNIIINSNPATNTNTSNQKNKKSSIQWNQGN